MLLPALVSLTVLGTQFGLPPNREEAYKVLGTDLGKPLFSFAVFADTQYGTMKPSGMRYYKQSLAKMNEMRNYLLEEEPDLSFVTHLGDMTQEKATQHRDAVLRELREPLPQTYHVLGNHDFKGISSQEEVNKAFNLSSRRYVFDHPVIASSNYKLIAVDTSAVSTFGNDPSSSGYKEAVSMSHSLKKSGQLHWETHNGGVGKDQMGWLENEIRTACESNQTVILFAHTPLLTGHNNNDMHTWDKMNILDTLSKYKCVKVWLNGHVHVHRHVTYLAAEDHHLHLWTTSGMVQTVNNSFVVVDVHPDKLLLRGVSWGTSFVKFLNFSSPLSDHRYDYLPFPQTHYLSRTHLAIPGNHNAPTSNLYPQGLAHPSVHAITLLPSGKAYPNQIKRVTGSVSTRVPVDHSTSLPVVYQRPTVTLDSPRTYSVVEVLAAMTYVTPVIFLLYLLRRKRLARNLAPGGDTG
eukprot:TRINITY_DN24468_c0_g1_i1.p1 TRINITY_DN24468_c0_g1~~TRINITY_DN24468_c0_g1_i1.p1  ORF type:complete len:463 (+),score=51.61 TRINITY_DN24468_c0_g1_i1:61-1449(+)